MKKDIHDIDHLFKTGLDGHQEDVPPAAWEAIRNKLDNEQVRRFTKNCRLWKLAAAIFLFAFLACVIAMYFYIQKQSPSIINHNHLQKSSPQTEVSKESQSTIDDPSTINDDIQINKIENNKKALQENKKSGEENIQNNKALAPFENSHINDEKNSRRDNKTAPSDTPIFGNLRSKGKNREKIKSISSANESDKIDSEDLITMHETKNGIRKTNKQKTVAYTKPKPLYPKESLTNQDDKEPINNKIVNNKNVEQHPLATLNDSRQPPNEAIKISPKSLDQAIEPVHAWGTFIEASHIKESNRNNAVTAQNVDSKKNKSAAAHNITLSIFISPNVNFYRFVDNNLFPVTPSSPRQDLHQQESKPTSLSGGLSISYGLTKNLSIQSGIAINSSRYEILPQILYTRADSSRYSRYELHTTSGFSYITTKSGTSPLGIDSLRILKANSKLTYISVPVCVNFSLLRGGFTINPSIGIDINFLKSGSITSESSNGMVTQSNTSPINGLKSSYINGRVGVGLAYNLTEHIGFELRPATRFALSPMNQQTPVKSYPNILSIETGIKIKF